MTKLLQYKFSAMSTDIELQGYFHCGTIEAQSLLQQAEQEFYRIARRFTRFSEESELTVANKSGGGIISDEYAELIKLLLELASFSNGKLDPTIIDLLEINGYKSSFDVEKIINNRQIPVDLASYLKKRPSWRNITLDGNKLKLSVGQRLDLGSIGKGYAISSAAKILSRGSNSYLINAGGDVYGRGEGWAVDLELQLNLPTKSRFITLKLAAEGQAIAASGTWARAVGDFHHLINSSTGLPTTTISSPEDPLPRPKLQIKPTQAFCLGSDATLTDGLSTLLCVSGKQFIDKIKAKYGYESLVVENGRIYHSDGFLSNLQT